MQLVGYPYVFVRLRCDLCKRSGQSRLVRLADKYGSPWRSDKALM